MFSHMWEGDEPTFQTVKSVGMIRNLDKSLLNEKLRQFCSIAHMDGYRSPGMVRHLLYRQDRERHLEPVPDFHVLLVQKSSSHSHLPCRCPVVLKTWQPHKEQMDDLCMDTTGTSCIEGRQVLWPWLETISRRQAHQSQRIPGNQARASLHHWSCSRDNYQLLAGESGGAAETMLSINTPGNTQGGCCIIVDRNILQQYCTSLRRGKCGAQGPSRKHRRSLERCNCHCMDREINTSVL